jgi:hypothetical protein
MAGLLTVGLQDRFVNNANKGLDLENRAYYMYVAYHHSARNVTYAVL